MSHSLCLSQLGTSLCARCDTAFAWNLACAAQHLLRHSLCLEPCLACPALAVTLHWLGTLPSLPSPRGLAWMPLETCLVGPALALPTMLGQQHPHCWFSDTPHCQVSDNVNDNESAIESHPCQSLTPKGYDHKTPNYTSSEALVHRFNRPCQCMRRTAVLP